MRLMRMTGLALALLVLAGVIVAADRNVLLELYTNCG